MTSSQVNRHRPLTWFPASRTVPGVGLGRYGIVAPFGGDWNRNRKWEMRKRQSVYLSSVSEQDIWEWNRFVFRLNESVRMIWERLMNVSELGGLLKSSMWRYSHFFYHKTIIVVIPSSPPSNTRTAGVIIIILTVLLFLIVSHYQTDSLGFFFSFLFPK